MKPKRRLKTVFLYLEGPTMGGLRQLTTINRIIYIIHFTGEVEAEVG